MDINSLLLILAAILVSLMLLRSLLNKKISASKKNVRPAQNVVLPGTPKIKNPDTNSASVQLEEKVWHQEETDFIFKLNEKLSLTFERGKFAEYIVEGVHHFFSVHKVLLVLLDQETKKFSVEYAAGIPADIYRGFYLNQDEGITGFIVKGREPLMAENIEEDYYLKKMKTEPFLGNSFMGVPLVFNKEAFGVLYIAEKKSGGLFKKRDLNLLVNVTKIASIAFESVRIHEEMQANYLKTITALALTIDARDHYTRFHSENVTKYAVAIAREMGLSTYQTEKIRRAGLLHDIGKIAIRDDILLKAGSLTAEEFEIIKKHPVKGEEIVCSLPFLQDEARLVRHHHERYDGGGYPDGLKAEDIELGARILTVADSFDAMTSDRPYRFALSLSIAIAELKKNSGTQFDPDAMEAFLRVLDKDPRIMTPGKPRS